MAAAPVRRGFLRSREAKDDMANQAYTKFNRAFCRGALGGREARGWGRRRETGTRPSAERLPVCVCVGRVGVWV